MHCWGSGQVVLMAERPKAVQALKRRETFSAYTQVAIGEGPRLAEGS